MDDKCFQYAVTVSLNCEEIKWNPERISNIKPFINKYNWKGINYPSKYMIGKRLKKIIQLLIFIFYKSKQRRLVQLIFPKKKFKWWKANNSISDSKWRKRSLALSCSKKGIYIIKRNKIKTSLSFLLLELSSFF